MSGRPTVDMAHDLRVLSESHSGRARDRLREAADRLAELDQLVRDLVDTTNTECHYDHNGFCQVHFKYKPCANARALEYIEDQSQQLTKGTT